MLLWCYEMVALYVIMQLRVSAGQQITPFISSIPQSLRRHKPQPLFLHYGRQAPAQNLYYDKNPYLLRVSPSEPRMRPILPKGRNHSQSRQSSEGGSHRSLKMIRLNGLREAEKPRVKQAEDVGRRVKRELELEGENRILRSENQVLREMLRKGEEERLRETKALQEKIAHLMQATRILQDKMSQAGQEWREEVHKLQENSY